MIRDWPVDDVVVPRGVAKAEIEELSAVELGRPALMAKAMEIVVAQFAIGLVANGRNTRGQCNIQEPTNFGMTNRAQAKSTPTKISQHP